MAVMIPTWEYQVLHRDTNGNWSIAKEPGDPSASLGPIPMWRLLAGLGNEGWELASEKTDEAGQERLIFKRPAG